MSFAPKNNMTVPEAEVIFEKYLANKPRIKGFIDETHEFVLKEGYVETMQGFRRNLKGAYSRDRTLRNNALRQSVNTIIQGTGAYLTNLSVIFIDEWLIETKKEARIVATVHDSILIDAPRHEIEEVAFTVKYIMENLPIDFLIVDWIDGKPHRYPIEADVEIGATYNDVVGYDAEELNTFRTIKGYAKYHLDKKVLKDHRNNHLISEEACEQGIALIEASKANYQLI